MRFLVLASLAAVAFALPRSKRDEAAVEQPPVDEDAQFNKQLLTELMVTLKNPEISKEDKHTAFEEALDNLHGDYQEKFEDLCDDIKESVEGLTNEKAKAAAEGMIEAFESGDLFGDRDSVKTLIRSLMEGLDEEAKTQLKELQKTYGQRFKEEFGALRPENDNEGPGGANGFPGGPQGGPPGGPGPMRGGPQGRPRGGEAPLPIEEIDVDSTA